MVNGDYENQNLESGGGGWGVCMNVAVRHKIILFSVFFVVSFDGDERGERERREREKIKEL